MAVSRRIVEGCLTLGTGGGKIRSAMQQVQDKVLLALLGSSNQWCVSVAVLGIYTFHVCFLLFVVVVVRTAMSGCR
jgi:hypothetical protein